MGLKDLLFPKKCVGCGKMGSYVCSNCSVGMWEEEQICPICCRNSRYGLRHEKCRGGLLGLTCLWAYEGLTRKILQKIKYGGFYDELNGIWAMGDEFWTRPEFYFFNKFLESKPTIVPIPLHPNRMRKRGFNQAELIGRSFAERYKLSLDSQFLIRVKDTGQQVGRSREVRLENMANAFAVNSKFKDLNSNILLVDDVWTTGATINSASKVLMKSGVDKIWGLVLAR